MDLIQILSIVIGVPLIGFWLWMLVDLTNTHYVSREAKSNWFLAIVLLNVFGASWYYLVEYRPRHL